MLCANAFRLYKSNLLSVGKGLQKLTECFILVVTTILSNLTENVATCEPFTFFMIGWLFWIIFVYLLSLLVAHLSDTPRRQLVVTGDSARIQDETAESSAWFFNVPGV